MRPITTLAVAAFLASIGGCSLLPGSDKPNSWIHAPAVEPTTEAQPALTREEALKILNFPNEPLAAPKVTIIEEVKEK